MQYFHFVIAALLLFWLSSGCEPGPSGPAAREQALKILCIGPSTDDPTWPVFEASAAAFMASSQRVKIEVVAPATRSPAAQVELLRSAQARQVQAVCIMPIDPIGIQSAAGELSRAGIPVITVGRDITETMRDGYCGPSEMEIGRTAVRACRIVLQHRSNTVLLLHGGMEHPFYGRRYHGFKEEAPRAGTIEVLREVDCGTDRFEAVRQVKAASRRFPRVGCWVFLGDWPLRELNENERLLPLGVTIVLCDANPRHWDRLRDGQIQAMIGYDLHEAIEQAFYMAVRLVLGDGRGFERQQLLASEIITIKELPQFERRWAAWRQGQPSPRSPESP